MADNHIRQLNFGVWPPQSPDLNPIEHLWPIVARKLAGHTYTGKEGLWNALKQAFAEVTVNEVQRLYGSMPTRVLAVIKAKGRHTRF